MSSTTAPATRQRATRAAALRLRLAVIAAGLVLWEVLARVGVIDPRYASSPSGVLGGVAQIFTDADALSAIGMTLASFVVAFVVGTALGIVAGVALGLSALLREAYLPVVQLLMSVPKSVFLPIIVLLVGLGVEAGTVFGAILAFVHVTVNVVAGLDLIEPRHLRVGTAYRAGTVRLFLDVILPGATAGIFAGIWHGIRNGFVGVVIAQLFVSTVGIGYLVRLYTNNFQVDEAMALIVVTAVAIILASSLWTRLENHLSRWRGVRDEF
ncbi:ABC transporter permease [Microbacterium marinilacus]|uniref:ABC transporter permease n=1 Tax=Microbacterium marinilacus TaxID=415209 RepID=A0ABP7BXP9_9MICO|nr:ABC transporter permease subunit [Microbacterium marinilacus]MBY0688231.1 ABC transporter permease subunit [Microbacterium marinilacus]